MRNINKKIIVTKNEKQKEVAKKLEKRAYVYGLELIYLEFLTINKGNELYGDKLNVAVRFTQSNGTKQVCKLIYTKQNIKNILNDFDNIEYIFTNGQTTGEKSKRTLLLEQLKGNNLSNNNIQTMENFNFKKVIQITINYQGEKSNLRLQFEKPSTGNNPYINEDLKIIDNGYRVSNDYIDLLQKELDKFATTVLLKSKLENKYEVRNTQEKVNKI